MRGSGCTDKGAKLRLQIMATPRACPHPNSRRGGDFVHRTEAYRPFASD
jgi:hypothetical protein